MPSKKSKQPPKRVKKVGKTSSAKMTNANQEKPSTDCNAVWKNLSEGLGLVFLRDYMAPQNYMNLYTSVYDFCTAPTVSTAATEKAGEQENLGGKATLDFLGTQMYDRLYSFVVTYVEGVFTKGADKCGEELLRYTTTEYENYRFSSKVMDGIFAYLNRHWIRRMLDENKEDVFMIYTLSLVLWRKHMFDKMKERLTDAVLEMIRSERDGCIINNRYISELVTCLVEMGLDDREDVKKTDDTKPLDVYKKHLEQQFLDATKDFYTREADDYLSAGGSLSDYMVKAEKRLTEENNRVQLYLHPTTLAPLAAVCHEVLITRHLESFQAQFGDFLVARRDEDLGRMYRLCSLVENGLGALRESLEKHITKEGLDAIKLLPSGTTDCKLYVSTLLEVHQRYEKLVSESFKGETGFIEALDKAATAFINTNAVTLAAPAHLQGTKSAELLVKYVDSLLRKSSKMPEEGELDDLLSKTMTIFKYIEDKDYFAKMYRNLFSKRLIHQLSASDEAEASFIAKMKNMCGYEFTSRLSKMVNDTQVSKDLTAEYKEKTAQSPGVKSIDFNVLVLSSGSWPNFTTIKLNIPAQLSQTIDSFTQFYHSKYTGRRLTWVYSQCRGEVTFSSFSKKYVFAVTTAQMCTLLLFNEQDSYTGEQIQEATGMEAKTTSMIIGSLVKNQVLKASEETAGEECQLSATISCNSSYANKKVRVDLSKMSAKVETVRETENIQKSIEDDRKNVISACIVRIMKTRKTFQHQQLISEVIGQLSGRFKPKVEVVKRCIGSLIEKEYLCRKADSRDIYEYVA